jgi:hypothetical protein
MIYFGAVIIFAKSLRNPEYEITEDDVIYNLELHNMADEKGTFQLWH